MARPGFEPGTPRFSGVRPTYRPAAQTVAKSPRSWGILRRRPDAWRSPRSPRYPRVPIVTGGFVPRGEIRDTNSSAFKGAETWDRFRRTTGDLRLVEARRCCVRGRSPPPPRRAAAERKGALVDDLAHR